MKASGFLLMEAVVAFFLVFLAGLTMFTSLQASDKGYTQATQIRVAVRLAEEGLESVRAGNLTRTVGLQSLAGLQLRIGRSALLYTPEIEISASGTLLLVRSRVSWQESRRIHRVELKTYVAP